jgi:hypothetical protein
MAASTAFPAFIVPDAAGLGGNRGNAFVHRGPYLREDETA